MELPPPPPVRSSARAKGSGEDLNLMNEATLKKSKVKTKQETIYSLFFLEETPRAESCSPETQVKGMSLVNDEREDWELETQQNPPKGGYEKYHYS